MSIRHEQFVESIKQIISKDDDVRRTSLPKTEDEADSDAFGLQKELERRFDEIFGPLDEDE